MKQHFSSVLHSWYRKALKHTKYRWLVILGTMLYLVSPIDISPDAFPLVGWIDDGIIVSLLISEVSQLVTEALKKKQLFNDTIKTELETIIDTDNVKTITVDAVTVS
ncbi:YkvA family protein [Synechococcus sp. PCC 7335]|uniref:YkvA family protein n=1 Tax=Synechococcus sp. (strain ATCC 29403 / PCC 7335) TaxID=91464 RepID=UPI000571464A|nr:YkvA family protein [Synechococcus sp. PCC 7335]